jgi:hypothetical protein
MNSIRGVSHLQLASMICLIFFFFSNKNPSYAQIPSWVDFDGKLTYPENEFFLGFVKTRMPKKTDLRDFRKELVNHAISELAQSISSLVEITNVLTTDEYDGNKPKTVFKSTVKVSSKIILNDCYGGYDFYFDDKSKVGFAIAFVRKKQLSDKFIDDIKTSYSLVELRIQEIISLANKDCLDKAILLFQCTKKEMDSITNYFNTFKSILNNTDKVFLIEMKIEDLNNNMRDLKSTLYDMIARNLNDLTSLISFNLQDLVKKKEYPVFICDIIYCKTNKTTEFSNILRNLLVSYINDNTDIKAITRVSNYINYYFLSSEYLENEGTLTFSCYLKSNINREVNTENTFNVRLSKDYFKKTHLKYAPIITDTITIHKDIDKNKLLKILGLYCQIDNDGSIQYLKLKDFELGINDSIYFNSLLRVNDAQYKIVVGYSTIEEIVNIPYFGTGKINFNSNEEIVIESLISLRPNKWIFKKLQLK